MQAGCGGAAVVGNQPNDEDAGLSDDSIPVLDLLAEYWKDKPATESKYLGQTVKVHGRGLYSFSDVFPHAAISLEGEYRGVSGAACWPAEGNWDYSEFRDLHGKGLVLQGRVAEFFNGSEYKAVILQDCEVVDVYADSLPEQSRQRRSERQ